MNYRFDQKYRSSTWRPEWGRCPLRPFKRCYPCRKMARTAVRGLGVGTIYRCEDCGKYHLTSYPPNVARAITYLLDSLRCDRRNQIKERKKK